MTDMRQPGGNQLFDLGWLIAAIEGEGSYILSKQYHHKNKILYLFPSIEIANDNIDFIKNCDRIIKEQFNVGAYISTRVRNNGKVGYKISLRGVKRLNKALPTLCKYSVAKKEQADLLNEYVSNRLTVSRGMPVSNRDIEIAISLRKLNSSHDSIEVNIPKRIVEAPND